MAPGAIPVNAQYTPFHGLMSVLLGAGPVLTNCNHSQIGKASRCT